MISQRNRKKQTPKRLQHFGVFHIQIPNKKECIYTMEIIAFIVTSIKEIITMFEELSTWRFIAILITIIICFAVWKSPEIVKVLYNKKSSE
ncbi:hypothetical protein GKDKLJBG_00487 [Mannheimia haemolytica]